MILVPKDKIEQYTSAGWWGDRTLGDLFLELVRARADQPAVADAPNRPQCTCGRAQRWSYAELLREVGRYAAFFDRHGLPYNSGRLGRQYRSVVKQVFRLAFPGG